jgi:hypothetical protein
MLGPPAPVVAPDPMNPMVRVIMDPALNAIWSPIRCDTLPVIAQRRLNELAKLMSSTKYQKWPDEWKLGVEVTYDAMVMAQMPAPQMPGAPGAQPTNGGPPQNPAGPEAITPERPGVAPEMQGM